MLQNLVLGTDVSGVTFHSFLFNNEFTATNVAVNSRDNPNGAVMLIIYCFAHTTTGENPCSPTSELDSCSHICLLAPRDIEIYQDGYSCHCPPGVQLLYDQRTCNTTGTSWVCWLILSKHSLYTFIVSMMKILSLCAFVASFSSFKCGRYLSKMPGLSPFQYTFVQKGTTSKCLKMWQSYVFNSATCVTVVSLIFKQPDLPSILSH